MSLRHLRLLLDLDQTLIDDGDPDETANAVVSVDGMPTGLFLRPHVDEFLEFAFAEFGGVAVWTAASPQWANAVLSTPPFTRFSFAFVWTGKRCTMHWRANPDAGLHAGPNMRKPLKKIWRCRGLKEAGWTREATLLVDDTPSNFAESYGNGICMPPYAAGSPDGWLVALRVYLASFAAYSDVRVREKRSWHVHYLPDGLGHAPDTPPR